MQINGIKSFKIDEVGPSADSAAADSTAEVSDTLDDVFSDPTETEETTSSTSPLDEYVINDPTASSGTPADRLANFPPKVEDIIAANEGVLRHLDLLKARYENTKVDLEALLKNYTDALPYVSATEAADLQRRIGYIQLAIPKCDEQKAKVDNLITNEERIEEQELAVGMDLNGNGLIGKDIGVIYDEDGKIHYVDPTTGKAIRAPITDPEYAAKVTNDTLEKTDAATVLGDSTDTDGEADIYLKLKDGVIESGKIYDNDFNAPICINVPEFLWVKKDQVTGWGKEDFEANIAKYVNDPSLWSCEDGAGLTQKVPDDKSNYVQIRVAKVEVSSKQSRYTDTESPPNPLYDTYIKIMDADETTITSIRITGYKTSANIPAAAAIAEGGNFVAASSVGIAFTDDQRLNPLELDATGYKSTCRHVINTPENLNALEELLGTSCPSDDPKCKRAYDNTLAAFQNDPDDVNGDFTTYYNTTKNGDGTEDASKTEADWQPLIHKDEDSNVMGPAAPYGLYQDRYIPTSITAGKEDSLATIPTGIFTHLSGIIRGTDYNDMFIVPGVNELSAYAEEHKLPDSEKIRKGDASYSTVIYGGTGNNLVRAGKDKEYQGDLYADGVGWACIDATGDSTIQLKVTDEPIGDDADPAPGEEREDPKRDPFNFVQITGAHDSVLYDLGETGTSNNAGYEPSLDNDYYSLSGNKFVSNIKDEDIVGHESFSSTNLDTSDANAVRTMYDAIATKISEDIAGIGAEDEEFDAGTKWVEQFGKDSEFGKLDAEMDSFFSEAFGDLGEFAIEMQSSES